MKSLDSTRRGFTIVELIVVIAVIGILASISLVSYIGSQNRAKKETYNATAQQTKLKLGEFYTDKNRYPETGTEVLQYLSDTGSQSLRDAIESSGSYDYQPRTSSGTSCSGAPMTCQKYTITVSASNWRGVSPADDVVVKP